MESQGGFPKKRALKSAGLFQKNRFYAKVNRTKDKDFNWFLLVNFTDSWVAFECEDSCPRMIQEALDKNGKWRPIEYWFKSNCSFSYHHCSIESYEYAYYKIRKYDGDFSTFLRVKYKIGDKILYTLPYFGRINESQFEEPEDLNKYGLTKL